MQVVDYIYFLFFNERGKLMEKKMSQEIKHDITAWKERGRQDKKLWRDQIRHCMSEIAKITDVKKRYLLKNEIGMTDYDLNTILKRNYLQTQRLLFYVKLGEKGVDMKNKIRLAYYQKRAEIYEQHLMRGSLELANLRKLVKLQNETFCRSVQGNIRS